MESVVEHIEAARSCVERVAAVVARWRGDGATAFLAGFPAVVAGQLELVRGRAVPADLSRFLPAAVGDDLGGFVSAPGRAVVPEIVALYHVGSVDLIDAAGHYEQAWRALSLHAVGLAGADRTACETVASEVLLATRDRLVGHGDDLCAAALLYAEARGIGAREILDPTAGWTGTVDDRPAESLRTRVVMLAAGHDPATLTLLLVDFTGGDTFAGLDRLPHTAAVITDPALADRLTETISGEIERRQAVLRRSGPFASVRDYERARAAGASLNPLPRLVIAVNGGTVTGAPSLGVDVVSAPSSVSSDDLVLLDILVARMSGLGKPAHRVWLPPLRRSPCIDDLLPQPAREPGRGLTVADAEIRGRLTVPVGIVDRPREQRRDLLLLYLSGHVLVVGGPGSGRSTLLRTLILSAALTHTPREVQFYGVDSLLRDLPHVGRGADPRSLLRRREVAFPAAGIDSMATYRRLRAQGRFASDPFGDVFLVIDGYDPSFADLVDRGAPVGIHVIASSTHGVDGFGTRVDLDRRGRGRTADGAEFLTALTSPEPLLQLVADIRIAWDGPLAPDLPAA